MPPYVTSSAQRISWRFRQLASGDLTPRSDLTAGLAVIAVIGQLLVAPLTLGLAVILLAIGGISRWRPLWLVLPAAAGLGWLLVIGVRTGLTGYLAGGTQLLGHLAGPGPLPVKLRQLPWVIADWRLSLSRQFPVALIAATLEAALAGLAGQPRRTWEFRPGGLVGARRRYLAATLRRGEVATSGGCCVGIVRGRGSRAEISWPDAESGVLCASESQAAVASTGRHLVEAAIQHRKAVIVIDLARDAPASSPGSHAPAWISQACAEVAAPMRFLGDSAAGYDPISGTSPARVAELTSQLGDDHALLAPVTGQLGELSAAPLGRLRASGPQLAPISLRRALAEREVVHFGLAGPVHGRSAAMIARLVVADLISNLADYCDLGARTDCLAWINGCEAIEPRQLAALVGLGARTGTCVVLGTTSAQVAAALVAEVNVVAVRGAGPGGLSRLAGLSGLAGDQDRDGGDDPLAALRGPGRPDALSLWVGRSPRVHVADCTVPS
jgi:hypothetical protein